MVEEHLHSSEQDSNKFYKAGDVDTDEKSLVESAMGNDVCNDWKFVGDFVVTICKTMHLGIKLWNQDGKNHFSIYESLDVVEVEENSDSFI